MKKTSLDKANEIKAQLIAWRRDFHMHPEVGFQEFRTSQKVAETLAEQGVKFRSGVGRTGVVADIGTGSPVLAIRADMDALPLQEKNKVVYASKTPGVMHACGHDSHTAMLLGVAQLLVREEFPGTVRLLFQPSEEVGDAEGVSGAPRMIQDGAMQGVDMVIALHVSPMVPTGQIQVDAGAGSGGVDSWFGRITGKGGHGAAPHKTIDPFYLTGHVIMALNAIVSRRIDPTSPAVVSIGSINGGHTENVIPEYVDLTGTLRYTESAIQKELHEEIRRAFALSKTLGGGYKLRLEIGDPPMVNDPQAVQLIESAAAALIGEENIKPMEKGLGAEDFGRFSQLAPGAMFSLGAQIAGDERTGHNPYFDIDENALPLGTAILIESAIRYLKQGKSG